MVALESQSYKESVELATSIADLDPSILSVGIVSNTGEALGAFTREAFRRLNIGEEHWKNGAFREMWGVQAFRSAMIFGSARTEEKLLSPLESVILVRKKFNIMLLTLLPFKPLIVGVIFQKNSDGQILSRKILDHFGVR
jgi:hypothetical protein